MVQTKNNLQFTTGVSNSLFMSHPVYKMEENNIQIWPQATHLGYERQ